MMINIARKFILLFLLMTSVTAFALPKEIIIVRHADKLNQKVTGPTIDAKGQVRAEKLAFYILKKFGKPDFIIATNPNNNFKHDHSIRELQTVAPLANMLAAERPNRGYEILHPYMPTQYKLLAKMLLHDKKFKGKRILICWDHFEIPQLTKTLGNPGKLIIWPKYDFDSVYILRYQHHNPIPKVTLLNHQYPVKFNGSWKELLTLAENAH